MATIIETYKGRHKSRNADQGDSAQRVFQVVGALNEDDAADELFSQFGVQVNSQFPSSSGSYPNELYCNNVFPRYVEPNYIEVTATYGVPKLGYYQSTEDALSLPWKYHWKTVVLTVPFDRDVSNNPVLNSGWDAPQNPPTKTLTVKQCTIKRNESFYDYTTYKAYENCVNSDQITLTEPNGNNSTFSAGVMKCVSIEPEHEYTVKDTFVTIVITIEIYDPTQVTTNDPHQLHLLDQGATGYYGDGTKRGNVVNADGSPVSQNILLNGMGKPVDSSLKISPVTAGGGPQTAVNCSRGTPTGATVETSVGSGVGTSTTFQATYLLWKRYKAVAFGPLLNPSGGGS